MFTLVLFYSSSAYANYSHKNHFIKPYAHGSQFKPDIMFPISGKLVAPFGWNTSFNQGRFNEGIYLSPNSKDNSIYSPATGKIVYLKLIQDTGITLGIKSHGFFTVVALPLENKGHFTKNVGDDVKKGELIGHINHGTVLFEVRDFHGNPYDPIRIITHKKLDLTSQNQVYIAFRAILHEHGFKSNEIKPMFYIASMESGLNPSALNYNRNGTVDIGLFQINSIWQKRCHVSSVELYDVTENIRCALIVLRNQGLSAWVTWNELLKNIASINK